MDNDHVVAVIYKLKQIKDATTCFQKCYTIPNKIYIILILARISDWLREIMLLTLSLNKNHKQKRLEISKMCELCNFLPKLCNEKRFFCIYLYYLKFTNKTHLNERE